MSALEAEFGAPLLTRGWPALPTATGTLIASQLRLFRQRHPRVAVRLLEGSDREVRDWLDQGVVDAGVVPLPAHGLRTAPLDTHDMVALVPSDHRLAAAEAVTYEDLAGEPFIQSTGGCASPAARALLEQIADG